jgi:uridine phosphorylase
MLASELILRPNGSIYHLGIRPEQVAPLIITVGDPERVRQVSKYFDAVECMVREREFVTHTGRLGQRRISVVSTGIGPDNVDIVLNELDALVNIDFKSRTVRDTVQSLTIVRLGTAGSLQAEIPTDSFVASVGAFGMDGLLQFYRAESQQNHPMVDSLRQHCKGTWDFPLAPYYAEAAPDVLLRFSPTLFHYGITATNPGFYGPQGRCLRAPVRQPKYLDLLQSFQDRQRKIVNLEMETAAIYGLSRLLGHRAVSLSAILANRPSGTFSRKPAKTVKNLIETALEIISSDFES